MKPIGYLPSRLLIAFAALALGSVGVSSAPVNLELWSRGIISLYDQDGNVFSGPDDWGVEPPYNWLTASWNGKDASWAATVEVGSDGWNNSSLRNIAFGYRFMENKVRVTLGQPFIAEYRVNSYVEWTGYGSRIFNRDYGFFVEAFPLAGLVLGGGLAVPLEEMPAEEVYDNVRFAASYTSEKYGKFNAAYINDSIDTDNSDNPDNYKKEFMFSTDFKLFRPIGTMFGYQGFFDGSGKQTFFGCASIPIRKFTLAQDVLARFESGFSYELRTQLSYALPFGSVGGIVWLLDTESKIGANPYVSLTTANGYIRFSYRPEYNYDTDTLMWSIPVTYDMWF